MEIKFRFSCGSKDKKVKVSEGQNIWEVVNYLISKDSHLANLNISSLLCNGNSIKKIQTFKDIKITPNDIICVICDQNNPENEQDKIEPIKFKCVKKLINHAHVNLENDNINAFIDRTFDVFKSLYGFHFLICAYSDNYKDYSLICMEITQEQIIYVKNNAHTGRVYTCQHYLDKISNRDLVITGSYDRTIKIWELNNGFQFLYMKQPDYNYQVNTYLLSEALLSFNYSLYLIVSAYELQSSGYYLLYYNLNILNQKNKLANSKDNCNYLETFDMSDIPFIIAANLGNVKIFDFEQKKLIKTFSDNNNSINYLSSVIQIYADKACLIATSSDGFLRIWDYHNPSVIIYKIQSYLNNWLIGLELIDNRFLLAGCADGSIKEFDLLKNYVAYTFPRGDKNDPLFTLKFIQINGQNYLFSHSHKGLIELWQ